MRFALIGADRGALSVVRAIVAAPDHQLVAAFDLEGADLSAFAGLPAFERGRPWETLLTRNEVDAVVLASGDEERRTVQLREMMYAEMPLIVSHPVFLSMLRYYELEMYRGDNRSIVVPYLPHRWRPELLQLQAGLAAGGAGPLGRLQQASVQRQIGERSRENVLARLATDADLVRMLLGDPTLVQASLAANDFGTLGVQLTGDFPCVAHWTAGPVIDNAGLLMSLAGERGRFLLAIPDDDAQPWRLELTSDSAVPFVPDDRWQPGKAALDALAAAIRGQSAPPDWLDASRTLELVDAAERSAQKGRGIALYYGEHTEQETFKGLMSGAGCLLLLLTLVLLPLGVALAKAVPAVAGLIPYILAAVLGLFVLAQALQFVFPPKK